MTSRSRAQLIEVAPLDSCGIWDLVGIEAMVAADIATRQSIGIAKYGTTLSENNLPLRAWLQHAYEEALDHALYLKRAIVEMEASQC